MGPEFDNSRSVGTLSKRLVITEKPSVAKDIAQALGGFSEGPDFHESDDFLVTWAVGHIVEFVEPHSYDPKYKRWVLKDLPIIPEPFELQVKDGQKSRFGHIKRLAKRDDVVGVINACDAGREGELIYRRIIEMIATISHPQERLWLQSMTKTGIREAFESLRDASGFQRLGDAAHLRAEGDWLVGINASRALTKRCGRRSERASWAAGRVQTPTLNLLVQRERVIFAHVPKTYHELTARFEAQGSKGPQAWEGKFSDPSLADKNDRNLTANRLFDLDRAQRILKEVKGQPKATVAENRRNTVKKPPLLFDLTTLQRHANQRYKISAARTLAAAQRLYEQHKLLTYPRTDSKHLPDDYGPMVQEVVDRYAQASASEAMAPCIPLAKRVQEDGVKNLDKLLNGARVTDHFAIVPTGNVPKAPLTGDDARVFEMVVRQFFAALMGPATYAVVDRVVSVDIPSEPQPVNFKSSSRSLEIPGFELALGKTSDAKVEQLPALVAGKEKVSGVDASVLEVNAHEKETKPPARYNEASLLRKMETAGDDIEDDEELSLAMKERGLGTPATRAETIEKLVKGGVPYARRVKGSLAPTDKGMRLIDVLERAKVAPSLASPKLTGEWEHTLKRVEKGEVARRAVRDQLDHYVGEVTTLLTTFDMDELYKEEPVLGTCPSCEHNVRESFWGYACERNTREDKQCTFIIWKERYGRYIDRHLVRRLLEHRKVEAVGSFVDQGGRAFFEASVTLRHEPEKERWSLDIGMENRGAPGADDEPEEVLKKLWPCPVYEGSMIVETTLRYVSEKVLSGEEPRGPVLPKIVCKREMKEEEVKPFFSEEGKTEFMDNFISKRGRPFRGALKRKPTGKHGFEFPPREPRKKGGQKKSADSD